MYSDDEFIQLSALQHFIFCPRQCALIHIEHVWSENIFTAEGRIMHAKVHDALPENRRNTRVEYGAHISSHLLGLNGVADVIEFHREDGTKEWIPFPVEYKRGKPKADDSDKVQLCAQAICLEEMLGKRVERGAIFYGKTRKRMDVVFDDILRKVTVETARKLHELVGRGVTPLPAYTPKCDSCSLVNVCLPKIAGAGGIVARYFKHSAKEYEKTP